MATVAEVITKCRSCGISSRNSSSTVEVVVISVFDTPFLLTNSNSDGSDNSNNTFKDFSECPKTSDLNSNATPFKDL